MNIVIIKFLLILFFIPNLCLADINFKQISLKAVGTNSLTPFTSFDLTNTANYIDISTSIAKSGYTQTNVFARARFSTSASSFTLTSYNSTAILFPGYGCVGLRIDGSDVRDFCAASTGFNSFNYTMSPGVKTVEFMTGMQLNDTPTTIQGSWLTAVTFTNDASATISLPSNTKRIVIYGDSISSGYYGAITPTNSPLDAWPLIVRNSYAAQNGSVAVVARGNRALSYDCTSVGTCSAIATELTNLLSGYATKIIYIQISTNDYGHSTQSAATFGTNYARLLDDIHSNDASAIIYAQTSTVRTSEVANSFGNTLGNYRTQISNTCNARSAYCTTVDGTSIVTTADLQDSVHPKESKQQQYADFVKTLLSIP